MTEMPIASSGASAGVRPPGGTAERARPKGSARPEAGKATAPRQEPSTLEALGTILIRNRFYRDGWPVLVQTTRILALALVASIALNALQLFYRPAPVYFASRVDGGLVALVPLDHPVMPAEAMMTWVTQAVQAAYRFDYLNHSQQLQESARKFTRSGWSGFMQALDESRNLDAVKRDKLVVTSALKSAPVIVAEGSTETGALAWKVQFALLVTWQSASEARTQNLVVTATVVRLDTRQNAEGLGIDQIVTRSQN